MTEDISMIGLELEEEDFGPRDFDLMVLCTNRLVRGMMFDRKRKH